MSYDPQNIFAKILRGELPSIKVYEDQHTLAFMDIMPQADGHTLVIPKQPAQDIFELSPEAMAACHQTVKKVGEALKKAFDFDGIIVIQLNGADAGQTVPHFHFHLLPNSIHAIKIAHGQQMAEQETLQGFAERIIACLD